MARDRSIFESLQDVDLSGKTLSIENATGERRLYTLTARVGAGMSGVAWEAQDWQRQTWAIKFVLTSDYSTHSLEAETQRVRQLQTPRVARIAFYGKPVIPDQGIPTEELYAVVAEWVDGTRLEDYLRAEEQEFGVDTYLAFARAFCEVLRDLSRHELCHNDLHAGNILVTRTSNLLTDEISLDLKVIDTGSLKTEGRRLELIESWQREMDAMTIVQDSSSPAIAERCRTLDEWIRWFNRTDQEWIVCHLCALYNRLQKRSAELDVPSRRFIHELPDTLDQLDDPDEHRRIQDPLRMHEVLHALWQRCAPVTIREMSSPFDLMSAELIRSDRQLMALFSEEFPLLDVCRSRDPVYLYGPRGCGKSTIQRSLSLRALLNSTDPEVELEKTPFIGVYVSCSSELRSRFWLMLEEDYAVLEAHIIRCFSLILVEGLLDTLDLMADWDRGSKTFRFGLDEDAAARICSAFRERIGIGTSAGRFTGVSSFAFLRQQVRREQDRLWRRILDREEARTRTDAQLIFDLCDRLGACCPVFTQRPLAFLLDDYSSQRIPKGLQQRINQAISFAKQGNPVFKVTSEYGGVDLAGIQEGREVREVNVGRAYVDLQEANRWRFLQDVLEKRFQYLGQRVDMSKVLPLSGLGPAVPMAKKICDSFHNKQAFEYHGLDTISDLCSGDFAMGLDLVHRIFEAGRVDWRDPRPVSSAVQNRVIIEYAGREFDYIRHHSPYGREKYLIADKLCWLARECILQKTTTRDGAQVPLIKIHLDIAETAWIAILDDERNGRILGDLISKGVLFPLDTSRAREAHQGTRRFQIRRILLARYVSALGRHTPIRIDDLERLRWLLTEPEAFARDELSKSPGPTLWDHHPQGDH